MVEIGDDEGGDQITTDHKEDIDADKAPPEGPEARMEQNHRQHGNRPQAIYFPSVDHGAPPGS
ncbi:hypothetical protein GCM10027396_09930 [Insolitispirillum peregrinum]